MATETILPGAILETIRYDRNSLEKGVEYFHVTETGRKHVGRFISTGYQGSGDGIEIVTKFGLGGEITELRESRWVPLKKDEISYFEKA